MPVFIDGKDASHGSQKEAVSGLDAVARAGIYHAGDGLVTQLSKAREKAERAVARKTKEEG